MVRSNEGLLKFEEVSREQFLEALDVGAYPQDNFAKTFKAKADMLSLWPCWGVWEESRLLGAIAWTLSKRQPTICNLQLLHTFYEYRRQGIARELCLRCLASLKPTSAEYFRVSSEPQSRAFYERLGIVFLGQQKSGCLLSVGKLNGATEFNEIDYSMVDKVVSSAVFRKGKGGCVKVFNEKSPPD